MYDLLKTLCSVHAPSGSEEPLRDFLVDYIERNSDRWKVRPQLIMEPDVQQGLLLVFGKPRTALLAHMDSIGFMVKYGKTLVKIGGPRTVNGMKLKGTDSKGPVECELRVDKKDGSLSYKAKRKIDTGTTLTFVPDFRESKKYIQCCYLDNRLGVFSALKVAETLTDGLICFTCWEEHGGGNAEVFGRYMYEKYQVTQALISDITWVTEGVKAGKGAAITVRDSSIPRRSFVEKLFTLAEQAGIPHQREVEDAGGSDGNALQRSPYPINWGFVGAPEQNVHTPDEKVHKADIESMIALHRTLMEKL